MTTESTPADAAIDHEVLLAEIYEEVERRRTSGELPAELERDLDRAFAEIAPPGAVGGDAELVLERVQRASFIQPRIPLEGLRPHISIIKRILFKLMAWYVHFVTEQVSAFGGAVTAALRSHDERIGSLEKGGAVVPPGVRAEIERQDDPALPPEVVTAAIDALAGARGRVLVAEAGHGSVLRALIDRGLDAYGTEPARSRLSAALREGLEIRASRGVDHLRALPERRLGGLLLVGAPVEASVPGQYADLVAEAARVVQPGGTVVVLSHSVEHWLAGDGGPAADLVPGRPLRPGTWAHLLSRAGFDVLGTVTAAPPDPLPPVDPAVPGAAELNQLIDRLGVVVAPSPAYALSARRRS